MTRGQAIAAKCRECIHDPWALGTWREQAGACGCTDCPLWRFRPLARNAPAWLTARDPETLPAGFSPAPHDDAIGTVRGNIDAKARSARVRAHSGTCERHPGRVIARVAS